MFWYNWHGQKNDTTGNITIIHLCFVSNSIYFIPTSCNKKKGLRELV